MSAKVLRQRDAMDCGPTCLAMIVAHYGREPDRDRLRTLCDLGKGGVSLLGISKAAETLGFRTVGGRISFRTLVEEAPLPCIAHWDQNHFVVVSGVRKHRRGGGYKVKVSDPAREKVTYSEEEFCTHWVSTKTNGEDKGVVLLLEPTDAFYRDGDDENTDHAGRHSRVAFLGSYLKKYRRYFLQLILGLLVGSLLQLIFPFL